MVAKVIFPFVAPPPPATHPLRFPNKSDGKADEPPRGMV